MVENQNSDRYKWTSGYLEIDIEMDTELGKE